MNPSLSSPAAKVLGVSIDPLNMESALSCISNQLEAGQKGYVCMVGVHGIMEAHRDPRLAAVYAMAKLRLPDGTPTVWVGRSQGHASMRRVTGPDLMLEIFGRKQFAAYKHFFYGGDEHVAEQLRESLSQRFPWARIVGTYTPPFRDLNMEEETELVARLHELKPDILWVGISTPRQEQFMHRYINQFETTLMVGVGAAFDFHTGRIQDAPGWVKHIGMQWMHRLLQDPRRLWKRYLRNNSGFIWHITLQLTGLRDYPVTQPRREPLVTAQPSTTGTH